MVDTRDAGKQDQPLRAVLGGVPAAEDVDHIIGEEAINDHLGLNRHQFVAPWQRAWSVAPGEHDQAVAGQQKLTRRADSAIGLSAAM
jgi:hypothetical protein